MLGVNEVRQRVGVNEVNEVEEGSIEAARRR